MPTPPHPHPPHAPPPWQVRRGSFSFAGREWDGVSEAAKRLVALMLTYCPDERPAAAELLRHPWLAAGAPPDGGGAGGGEAAAADGSAAAPAAALCASVLERLRHFAGQSRLKRLALACLARSLTADEAARLRVRARVLKGEHVPCRLHKICPPHRALSGPLSIDSAHPPPSSLLTRLLPPPFSPASSLLPPSSNPIQQQTTGPLPRV